MSRFRKRETQAEFFKRIMPQKEPDIQSTYETSEPQEYHEMHGSNVKPDEEPSSIYFRELKKEIKDRPDAIKMPKFRKPKKTNVHKNNIEFVIS